MYYPHSFNNVPIFRYRLISKSFIILNSARQHNHFITQGNYKATFFDYGLVIFRTIFVN